MKKFLLPLMAGGIAWPCLAQSAQDISEAPERSRELGMVTVTGGQPSSLPTQIPTTIEGITREEIETRINATDSEDALKYMPSLLVRKRYIGDYNHAILSTRASGTGNSARSPSMPTVFCCPTIWAMALPTTPTTRRAGALSHPRKSSASM